MQHSKLVFTLTVGLLAMSSAILSPSVAEACGGCFHSTPVNQNQSTQVTSHRMLLSVSQTQSTLWDQVEYVGDATDFAWVLPIHGTVQVGVSSDALFTRLEALTQVTVDSPTVECPTPTGGNGFGSGAGDGCAKGATTAATGVGVGGGDQPVTDQETVHVLQQEAVGPYDTVQLSSTDPMALRTWLGSHGYVIPDDVSPIIDDYVNNGFDFLAVRLAPGMGVQAMQPIRVTTPGASLTLPLKMVSAGTGASTALTLWVLAEGRYAPVGIPTVLISENQLVWDWGSKSSNYATLRHNELQGNRGDIWLVASAAPMGSTSLDQVVTDTMNNPAASGYAGTDPVAAAQADVATALTGIAPNNLWFTRLYAELPRSALTSDLTLGADPSQSIVSTTLLASKQVGNACASVTRNTCGGFGDGVSDGSGGDGSLEMSGNAHGCAIGDERGWGEAGSAFAGACIVAGALAGQRRRKRNTIRPAKLNKTAKSNDS